MSSWRVGKHTASQESSHNPALHTVAKYMHTYRKCRIPYIFFLPPFLPLEMRLFLPTAMLAMCRGIESASKIHGKNFKENLPLYSCAHFARQCPPKPPPALTLTLALTLIPFIALTNVTNKFRVRVWLCAGWAEREAGAMANLLCSRRDCSFDSRSAVSPLRYGTSLALIRAWIDCFVFGSFCKVVSRRGGLLPRFSLSDLALGKTCTRFFLR